MAKVADFSVEEKLTKFKIKTYGRFIKTKN